MDTPNEPVTLTGAQVEELARHLSHLRHNVNNHLALIVAAIELIKRKPELGPKMMASMNDQPQKIVEEIRRFSEVFNRLFRLTRG